MSLFNLHSFKLRAPGCSSSVIKDSKLDFLNELTVNKDHPGMFRKISGGGAQSMFFLLIFPPCYICTILQAMTTFLPRLPLPVPLSHRSSLSNNSMSLLLPPHASFTFSLLPSGHLPCIFSASLSSAFLPLLLLLMAFEAN